MTLFGIEIKTYKEAKKDLDRLLKQGQDQVLLTPPNYPSLPTPQSGSQKDSTRRTGYIYKKR